MENALGGSILIAFDVKPAYNISLAKDELEVLGSFVLNWVICCFSGVLYLYDTWLCKRNISPI